MADHYHYEYAEARHDHRGDYADSRHDHDYEYAGKHHRHYDDESTARGLREDLGRAEERIRELEDSMRDALERIGQLEDLRDDEVKPHCGARWPNLGPAGGEWGCTLAAGHDGDHEAHVATGKLAADRSAVIPQGHPDILTDEQDAEDQAGEDEPGGYCCPDCGRASCTGEDCYWPDEAGIARPEAEEDTVTTYTHPDVLTVGVTEGWAEAETDPTRIDWAGRQARAAIPFQVVDGRPVNPCQKTGIRHGRNEMGFWGENLMADALVTLTYEGGRYLLMVERADGYGWAVPGGHVEPGETGLQAAVRELAEETGLTVDPDACQAMPPRYVPDPRASDEAWAVTVPAHIDLGERYPAAVTGGDDARQAAWMLADDYGCLVTELAMFHVGGRVFAAHEAMLREFLGEEGQQ